MGVKMTLTFSEETMETLRKKAREEGFDMPSRLARYLLVRSLKEDLPAEISEDRQVLQVPVDNYQELKDYVESKKLGNISVFAVFAMERYMSQYPPKKLLKRQVEGNIEN